MEGSVPTAGWLVILFVAASALTGCVEGAVPVLAPRPPAARHVAGNLMAQPGSVGNADGITPDRRRP
jgi:hypothetical protein